MKATSSFQQLLEDQMDSQDSDLDWQSEVLDFSPSPDLEPAILTALLGRVPVTKSQRKFQQQTAYKAAAAKPVVPHRLNSAQQAAAQFFATSGVALSPRFKIMELKKAYWRLAKDLHPDQSGRDGTEFQELKRHHSVLMSFLVEPLK